MLVIHVRLSSGVKLHQLDHIEGNGQTVKVIKRVASEWEKVATRLYFEGHDISCIKKDSHYQSVQCCRTVFTEWLEVKGCQPVSWDTLIKVLIEADLPQVASDLKFVLGSF